MVQLELGKFGVKKPPAGEQGRKALLKNCLRSAADLIRRAELYLEFPEVNKQGLWGMDPERIVTDPLHATLRLHPKLFWFAFMDPLSNKVPNADKLVERAANMLIAITGFKKICTIQFVNKSEIVEWSLKEHHSREILKCFCDPDMTKNPLSVLIPADKDNTRAK